MISKEGSWWTGKLNGVQGVFPSNYVQQKENRAPTPPTTSHPSAGQGVTVLGKPVIAKVVAAYTRTKDSQLNLAPGDLVKVHVHCNTCMVQGCVHVNGHYWWHNTLLGTREQFGSVALPLSCLYMYMCSIHACKSVCVCVCVFSLVDNKNFHWYFWRTILLTH